MTELYIFASTFAVVMLLGLQSLNVNGGHHIAAFATSFGIGTANLVLFKLVPDASLTEMLAYLFGGPFGILLAMWIHPRIAMRFKRDDILGGQRRRDYVQGWNDCRDAAKKFLRKRDQAENLNCGADRP